MDPISLKVFEFHNPSAARAYLEGLSKERLIKVHNDIRADLNKKQRTMAQQTKEVMIKQIVGAAFRGYAFMD